MRDLLRKRAQLDYFRTANILSIQNQYWRNTGAKIQSNDIQRRDDYLDRFEDANIRLAMFSNVHVMDLLAAEIQQTECQVRQQVRLQAV